jgi:hypothetical protein
MSAPCLQSTIRTILHHVVVFIPRTHTTAMVCAQSAGVERPRKLHNTAAECRQPPGTALPAAMRAPAAAEATLARRCGHSTASGTRTSVPLASKLRRGSMAAMLYTARFGALPCCTLKRSTAKVSPLVSALAEATWPDESQYLRSVSAPSLAPATASLSTGGSAREAMLRCLQSIPSCKRPTLLPVQSPVSSGSN